MSTPTNSPASPGQHDQAERITSQQRRAHGARAATNGPTARGDGYAGTPLGGDASSAQGEQGNAHAQDERRPRITGYIVAIGMIAALAGFLFGFDTGVVSGAQLFYTKVFHMGTGEQELSVGSVLIGTVIGAAIAGPLADRLGRRGALIMMAVIFGSGAILTALAWSSGSLIVFRIYTGIAVAAAR